ncbi:lymphocyte cytosolic protein 2a isoform X2 [Leuresthes tenuis]|uniref:lymphocyte cytosolic protein 2a isoform X2 n=1 Tax=Leuresthes tenuis TaxID=355514 RepID=UPI003B514C2B
MSLERPSRSEVMAWSPQQLAEYLRRCNLTGCDKVVLKSSISGSRFVSLTDNDLQKFPKLHTPMISKISNEISKKEDKKGIFPRWTPKNREPEATADDQGWDDEEFDDADDDYESPYSDNDEGSGGDYESPNDDLDTANDYEPPPSEPQEDQAHKLCSTMPVGEYIDKRDNHMSLRGPPPALCPRPPVSNLSAPSARMPGESASRRDPSPNSAGRTPGNLPSGPPKIFRQNKPGRDSGSSSSPVRGHNSLNTQGAQSWRPEVSDPTTRPKPPILPPPFPTSVTRSNSSARPSPGRSEGRREQTQDEGHKHNTFPYLPPRPGIPGPPGRHADSVPSGSLPHNLQSAMAEHRSSSVSDRPSFRPPPPASTCTKELDPLWYVGKVTRGQAEGCLKQVWKDGAYLVRDSTRQQPNQPFTLMVFYQDKVYNIQIRQQNQQFQLGTGLKVQESFPSVSDIIRHYSQSPLLLIDAKNRSASQQNQCLLSNPAGYHMTR